MRLSVAIIARDEERHIGAAIESVAGLADEVLVLLDDRTRDQTGDIARAHGARVLSEPWRGFPAQRNRALSLCRGDWVLFLDADERVSPELAADIRALLFADTSGEDAAPEATGATASRADRDAPALQSSGAPAGCWLPRHNQFFGRVARGGGWYPDEQLRLLRRGRARYDERLLVHEVAALDGPAAHLCGHLLHLNIERLDELWRKQRAYAFQEAQTLFLAGRRARWRNFAGAPLREFRRRYLALGGWRDGWLGLLLCGTLAYFEWVKFVHLKALELGVRG
jgi:glycosyltransferase involved in cell wall biosynthesis